MGYTNAIAVSFSCDVTLFDCLASLLYEVATQFDISIRNDKFIEYKINWKNFLIPAATEQW